MKIVRKRQIEALGKCPIKKNPLVGSGLFRVPDLHWGLDNRNSIYQVGLEAKGTLIMTGNNMSVQRWGVA